MQVRSICTESRPLLGQARISPGHGNAVVIVELEPVLGPFPGVFPGPLLKLLPLRASQLPNSIPWANGSSEE